MKTLARLLGLLAPFRWWLALAVLLHFATLGAGIGLMAMSAYLISKAALVASVADLGLVPTFVRLFAISRAVLRYGERMTTHTIAFGVLARLRAWFYRAIEPLAPARLQRYHSGDLFARIGADIETLQDFYARVVVPPIAAALAVALACAMLGSFQIWLGVVLLAFLLLTGVALPLATRWLSRQPASRISQRRAALATTLADGVRGGGELLAFGQGEHYLARVDALGAELHREQERMALIRALGVGLGALFTGLASLLVLGMGIPLVAGGALPGEWLAVLPLVAIASFEAVQPLAQAVQHLASSQAAAQRLFELIDAEPEVAEPALPAAPPTRFDLVVRGLSFRYLPGQPVLHDLGFELAQGARLTIAGPSGSGKSTLLGILLRFWDYHEGSIQIGGRELRDMPPEAVRACFGVVAQDTYLFNTSIRENLLLARADASDTELLAACAEAQLGELLAGLPDGLDTAVGENGMQLSGGERQRLALARAMLKNAPILLLDEATASLDPLTEQRVQQALDRFARGRTTIVFSHLPGETTTLLLGV